MDDVAPVPADPPALPPVRAEPVRVWGIVRGREVAFDGAVEVDADGVTLAPAAGAGASGVRSLTVSLAALDGARADGAGLTLFVRGGDVLELSPGDGGDAPLAGLAALLERRACPLGEQTLRLRGLGSRRGAPGAEHDRFFAPLLDGRVAAERAEPAAQPAAFDTPALVERYERLLHELAAARHPREGADQRALEAELADHAEPLVQALDDLGRRALAARQAPDDQRFARHHEWCAALGRTFDAADRAWLAMLPALDIAPPRARRGILGRLLGRGRGLTPLVAAALAAAPAPAAAQDGPRVTLRVRGAAPDSLRARGFDVVDVGPSGPLVVAGALERARLAALGFAAEPLTAAELAPSARRAAGAATLFRPYDDPARGVGAFLDSLARANPRVHIDTIGQSVEGRAIVAAKVGDAGDAPARANVLFMATYHAREWAAAETAMRLLRFLADPAAAGATPAERARVDALVAARDVWVVPVVNPDGYQHSHAVDRLWRKNRRPLPSGAIGVDLNRNHDAHWGLDDIGSSALQGSELYRGPSPSSEPEVQAVERFHRLHPPVVSVSYHTFSNLLIYPPGFAGGLLPHDLGTYRALAGTPAAPAVVDRLPGTRRPRYHPGPGWHLYPTNGEYTDWASTRFATLAFTPELTSGWEGAEFYGFEFPDDEAKVAQLFRDNLPFALDLIDAAADPARWRSPTTGLRAERVAIESAAPTLRVRVPVELAAAARVRVDGRDVALAADTLAGARVERRLGSVDRVVRPSHVDVTAGALSQRFDVVAATGAEAGDVEWTSAGFAREQGGVAGAFAWVGTNGTLRSPVVQLDSAADTVTVAFWTRHVAPLADPARRGELRVSRDGGRTWRIAELLEGGTPVYYPEQATIGGVAGRQLQLEFAAVNMSWRLDEVVVLAHAGGAVTPLPGTVADASLAPSANPVRGDEVWFRWPFAPAAGDVVVYDLAGRPVWRAAVAAGAASVRWSLVDRPAANGAYLAVARAGARTVRRRVYVARPATR